MGSARQEPVQESRVPVVVLFLFLFWEVGECLGFFLSPHLGFSRTIVLGKGGGFLVVLFNFKSCLRACQPRN